MKIFIVDDEPLIIKYIAQCIQDIHGDYEVVGHSVSAMKAPDQIDVLKPDIVFTDITMPKISGIDLLKTIKNKHPEITVAMLTCHEDFEYARQAIQNRADDYILKSEITPSFLKEKLEKLSVSHKRVDSAQFASRNNQAQLLKVPSGYHSGVVRIVSKQDLHSPELLLQQDSFAAFAFLNIPSNVDAILGKLPQFFSNVLLYAYDQVINVLLCNIDNCAGCNSVAEKEAQIELFAGSLSEDIVGVVSHSNLYYRLVRIPQAIEDVINSAEWNFYGSPLAHIPDFEMVSKEMQHHMVTIVSRIESGNLSSACRHIKEMLNYAEKNHPHLEGLYHNLRQSVELVTRLLVDETPIHNEIALCGTFDDLRAQVINKLDSFLEGKSNYSRAISEAIDYMKIHYMEDINLTAVADNVFLNREYFSRQFKKETGIGFSDYLMELRLEEALNLLRSSELNTSEIACRVGFSSGSYFSSVFKKKYGLTPKQVRLQTPGEML